MFDFIGKKVFHKTWGEGVIEDLQQGRNHFERLFR